MTTLTINKLDAAQRQLDTAIRLTFSVGDPVAIHTLAAAASRIIRDLCEARGDVEAYLRFTDWIKPEYLREFWGKYNASANFLKHADQDHSASHDLNPDGTDYLMLNAVHWYHGLESQMATEMRVFMYWFAACHPNILIRESDGDTRLDAAVAGILQASELTRAFNRDERIKLGGVILDRAKQKELASGERQR